MIPGSYLAPGLYSLLGKGLIYPRFGEGEVPGARVAFVFHALISAYT